MSRIKPLKLFEMPEYPNLSLEEADSLDARFRQEPLQVTVPIQEQRVREIVYIDAPHRDNTLVTLGIIALFGLFGLFAVLCSRK